MTDSVDRRVRKTRQTLKNGLAELMREKPVNEISVRELSELCDINRGTFYLHYKDVFDMLEKVESEFYDDFCSMLSKHDITGAEDIGPMLEDIFRFIAAQKELCAAVLGKYGNTALVQRIVETVKNACIKKIEPPDTKSRQRFERCFWFIVSGAIGVGQAWLVSDDPEPPEEIAALLNTLIFNGINSFYKI